MEISFEKDAKFRGLLSGDVLNAETTAAFLTEVFKETIGSGGIAQQHLVTGQGSWPRLSQGTLKGKTNSQIFVESGRVQSTISTAPNSGTLRDWGSSADIFSTSRSSRKRYSSSGIYAAMSVSRTKAFLTIGFQGKYKHSAGFQKVRRELAREHAGKKKISAKDIRRFVSVGETERKLKSINADRKARGLKTITKSVAKGSAGISGRGHKLARGKDNLAYADIVQRGQFLGIMSEKGVLFNPKGVAARRSRWHATAGKATHGVGRPLLPFKSGDQGRIEKALDRGLQSFAREINRPGSPR